MKKLFELAAERHKKIAGIMSAALGAVARNPLKTLGAGLTVADVGGAAAQGFKTIPRRSTQQNRICGINEYWPSGNNVRIHAIYLA
jgi:hypothetical protein